MILLIAFVSKYTLSVEYRMQIKVIAELTCFDVCFAFCTDYHGHDASNKGKYSYIVSTLKDYQECSVWPLEHEL